MMKNTYEVKSVYVPTEKETQFKTEFSTYARRQGLTIEQYNYKKEENSLSVFVSLTMQELKAVLQRFALPYGMFVSSIS